MSIPARLRALAAIALLTTLAALAGPAWALEIPPLSGRVVDAAGMLNGATRAALEAQLADHEAATSNQVVVLTVPDLQGQDDAGFALAVARDWGLGQADKDNGALLLIAREERAIRIEVGYGLEGSLTDARAKRIISREIQPAFKRGDFNTGVSAGVSAILGTIEGSYQASDDNSTDGALDSPLLPMGLFALIGSTPLLRRFVGRQALNGLVVGSFAGVFIAMASQLWWAGLLGALAVGAFVAMQRASNADGSRRHYGDYHDRFRHGGPLDGNFGGGGFGGGGFGGGGGGFGGGGASGGW